MLAASGRSPYVWCGILLWGLHMGITQGLLARMVADCVPADLRGTGFGLFNLMSGLAMLAASGLAGYIWDRFGATQTFIAGGALSGLALLALLTLKRRGE